MAFRGLCPNLYVGRPLTIVMALKDFANAPQSLKVLDFMFPSMNLLTGNIEGFLIPLAVETVWGTKNLNAYMW